MVLTEPILYLANMVMVIITCWMLFLMFVLKVIGCASVLPAFRIPENDGSVPQWEEVHCAFDKNIRNQAFVFYVGEGSYRLRLRYLVRFPVPSHKDQYNYSIEREGWYIDGWITAKSHRATVFEVDDVDITGIEVRAPADFLPHHFWQNPQRGSSR